MLRYLDIYTLTSTLPPGGTVQKRNVRKGTKFCHYMFLYVKSSSLEHVKHLPLTPYMNHNNKTIKHVWTHYFLSFYYAKRIN